MFDNGKTVVTRMRERIAYRRQTADDQRIAISMRIEFRSWRESQQYREDSREQPCLDRNRPVHEAQDIAPAPRHAGHARTGGLPETLGKQAHPAFPLT